MTEIAPVSFENTTIAFSAKDDKSLKKAYFLFSIINYSWLVKIGINLAKIAFKLGLPIKKIVKETIFALFCGGESIKDCSDTIRSLSQFHIGTILDYAEEGTKNEQSFEATTQEVISSIHKASISFDIPFSVFKPTGVAPFKLLAKIQNNEPLSKAEQEAFQRVQDRFDRICRTAYEKNVRLMIDAEESWIQQPIDDLVVQMMAKYNKERAIVYNTYQIYLKDKLHQLKMDLRKAAVKNFYLGAKIVRGAYMEKERKRAQKLGYPDPIQPDKATTDDDFDKALKYCIQNKKKIAFVAGTHNEYSCYYLTVLIEKYNLKPSDPHIYFAQLFGMSDHISYNLAKLGFNVAKYVPYGPVEKVMPYLFRRAEENTSITGQSSRELTLIKRELKRRKT